MTGSTQFVYHFMINTTEYKKEFCPHCKVETEVSFVTHREVLPVLGEPTEFEAHLYKCNVCQAEFASEELEDRNLTVAYNIYREKNKLLSSEKIKAIRQQYGLSQRNFSKLLKWGEITIHRYESGAIQDEAHNETLVLFDDNPQNALTIFNLHRDNLPEDVALKLERRLNELLSEKKECKRIIDLFNTSNMGEEEPSLNTGFIRFDLEKFENMILYILKKMDGVFKTKLNKLLWYCDSRYFKQSTISISGAKYIHLPYGPVPDNYDLFLWKLQGQKKVGVEEVIWNDSISGEKMYSLVEANTSFFNENELKTIDYVIDSVGYLTAGQISDKSHNEDGYKKTGTSDVISYAYALKLSI